LNGKAACAPQWARWRAWAAAWRKANAEELLAVQKQWRSALLALSAKARGKNGKAFLKEDIMNWVADLGAMQIMLPTGRSDPEHFDGGASFLHIGITLWGRRAIRFKVEEEADGLLLESRPGQVYFGSLCCASHHVEHQKQQDPGELLAPEDIATAARIAEQRDRYFGRPPSSFHFRYFAPSRGQN
jgi:hypothetical protein